MDHEIDYPEAFEGMQVYLKDCLPKISYDRTGYKLLWNDENFLIPMDTNKWPSGYIENINKFISSLKEKIELNSLIHGKDNTQNIVSCEIEEDKLILFLEENGIVRTEERENRFYILSGRKYTEDFIPLQGNLHYRYIKWYDNKEDWFKDKKLYHGKDVFTINDTKEAAMVIQGFTYFKGMKVNDVSVLSFDIETTGLTHDSNSKVLLISNTYRSQGQVVKRLFALDDFINEKEMIDMWCGWVRARNPSIILGHNIFGFDIPYLDFCANRSQTSLKLGRNDSDLWFNKYESKFRKDGSQDYTYRRAFIYGREIIDTNFLAYHFDFARKYESYGLKAIIKHEGLEKVDRVFYDAGQIAKDWPDEQKRKLIKRYAEDDADDALALYDLMIASYFYLNQTVPKSFQTINYSATGAQINSFLIRSYLQHGHGIPQTSPPKKFIGALSFGNPGNYRNCWKFDISGLYPSIIRQYEVYDKEKDPKGNFFKMVEYFTLQRFADKKKAKETGDRYYSELEQSRKVFVNSAYGLLGANGLQFNSFDNAEFVTTQGREILKKSILWATGNEFIEKIEQNEVGSEEILNDT